MTLEEKIVDIVRSTDMGIGTSDLACDLGLHANEIAKALEYLKGSGTLTSLAGRWMNRQQLSKAQAYCLSVLAHLHHENPDAHLIPCSMVAAALGRDWGTKTVERLAQSEGLFPFVRLRAGGIAVRDHRAPIPPRSEALLEQVERYLLENPLVQIHRKEMAEELRLPIQAVNATVELGLDTGRLIEVEPSFVVTTTALQTLVESLGQLDSGDGFSVSDFKMFTHLTRKSAIPILEWLDAHGYTHRCEDHRHINPPTA